MSIRWFYSHANQTHGPLTVDQVKAHAASGDLEPHDMIWAEGADPATAVAAEQALDFRQFASAMSPDTDPDAEAPAESKSLPAALDDDPDSIFGPPAAPCFVDDLDLNSLPAISAEPASPAPWPDGALPPAVAAVHEEKLPINERYRRACFALGQWADREANASLVMTGDTEAICTQPEVLQILAPFQHLPFEVLEHLMEHLDFLVENRGKYYRAMAERGGQPG